MAAAGYLHKLELDNNGAGDVGVVALARALDAGAKLAKLFLGGLSFGNDNVVGDEGAVALAAAVTNNLIFRKLVITGYEYGAVGEAAFLAATEERDDFKLEAEPEILTPDY